ncbi:MAG: Rne/Rng family ribonuclease [Zetaproteobacteria bacterium]|nr:Rne/Rng family ribonuclease [Zetaproteobacteria bacterium]
MNKKILINDTPVETRIALLEEDRLAEMIYHRRDEQRRVGNIYKGIIKRVLPGMNAAFVDIGARDKAAFLYGGDVFCSHLEINPENLSDEDWPRASNQSIEDLLFQGQEVLVQVNKEALGTKGPRITMHLTLPGRNLVYLPLVQHVGISRRIEDKEAREKLKEQLTSIKPLEGGIIARTAALGVELSALEKELHWLHQSWLQIKESAKAARAPSLIHTDMNIIKKTIRDLYDQNVTEVISDNPKVCAKIESYLEDLGTPETQLHLHRDKTPLFDSYGVEVDLAYALRPRVDLPSGGYLIIQQTEALTSLDVNTGKFVGRSSAQETILKTNLEAARIAVEQLRLRNLGGIIIIDFIDMESGEHRENVYLELMKQLKKDRSKTNVQRISEFGLVEMTRKRTSESLTGQLMSTCTYCEGYGHIRSIQTEALDLIREIERRYQQTGCKNIEISIREDLFQYVITELTDYLNSTREKYALKINFQLAKSKHLTHFSFEVN